MTVHPSTQRPVKGQPTLEQVAAHAGVGRGTVSRVVNGSTHVSEPTRAAVLKAVQELGYVPNRAARSLVTRRTDTVALLISESEERIFGQPFFASIVRGISAGVSESSRQLLLAMAQSPEELSRFDHYLTTQHVDGVLLLSLHGDDPLPRHLEERGVPMVLGGRPSGWTGGHFVDVDNRGGAAVAVEHLMERGRRRIATVTGPPDMTAGQGRYEGYVDALTAAGIEPDPSLVSVGDFSEAGGERAMTELLERRPDIDGVFAASDLMAIGALRVLRLSNRAVPDDVAVVGFDDSPLARLTDPPLTTVHQPAEQMGRDMARLLVAQIDGSAAPEDHVLLDTDLVVRDST